jgi:hypothetical protein
MADLITTIIIAVIILYFINYIQLRLPTKFGWTITTILISIYLIFSLANIQDTNTFASFYLYMTILTLIFVPLGFISLKEEKSFKLPIIGSVTATAAITVFLGALLCVAFLAGSSVDKGASIIGTPNFAIQMTGNISVINSSLVGFMENRFFFLMFELLLYLSLILPLMMIVGQILPILAVSFTFALFHFAAYSGQAVSLFGAGVIMFIWLLLYKFADGELITCNHHYLHNMWVSATKFVSF